MIQKFYTKLTRIPTDFDIISYYEDFFNEFSDNELFEVYDLESGNFVQFIGKEGSEVVNKKTLINNLVKLEFQQENMDAFVIIKYDADNNMGFVNPVFIGKRDCYGDYYNG